MAREMKYTLRFIGTSPDELSLPDLLDLAKAFTYFVNQPQSLRFIGVKDASYGAVLNVKAEYLEEFHFEMADADNDNISKQKARYRKQFQEVCKAKNVRPEILDFERKVVTRFAFSEEPTLEADLSAKGFRERFHGRVKVLRVQSKNPGSKRTQVGLLPKGQRRVISDAFADHQIGVELAKYYRKEVTIFGMATYDRTQTGEWQIAALDVEGFSPERGLSPWEVFDQLDALEVEWPRGLSSDLSDFRGAD